MSGGRIGRRRDWVRRNGWNPQDARGWVRNLDRKSGGVPRIRRGLNGGFLAVVGSESVAFSGITAVFGLLFVNLGPRTRYWTPARAAWACGTLLSKKS